MMDLYLTDSERAALAAITDGDLERLIDQAMSEVRTGDLQRLRLPDCGPYVASKYRSFDRALTEHREARSSRKRDRTESNVHRAGFDLKNAVRHATERMEIELKEEKLFRVDERIAPPYHFASPLSVRVAYQWRRTVEDQWEFGCITFVHDVELRPSSGVTSSGQKLTAAKRAQKQQDELVQTWDHLVTRALHSVRDYLRSGGDPTEIPGTYQVAVDPHSRLLNNYSAHFWLDRKPRTV